MKVLAVVAALSVLASVASIDLNNLYAKFKLAALDPTRNDSYFEIPLTFEDAVFDDWVQVGPVNSRYLTVYCMENDPRFCILLDVRGVIHGFQLGILVSDVANMQSTYNMSKFDIYQIKKMFDVEVWTITIHTKDPTQDSTGMDGVWIERNNGSYEAIPRNATQLDPIWTKENCITGMGTHYYHNMSTAMECENFYPIFFLYIDGMLSGVGIQAFGTTTITNRMWYENIPSYAVRPTIPDAPQCLVDWVAEYTLISIHVFLTKDPWNITCQ